MFAQCRLGAERGTDQLELSAERLEQGVVGRRLRIQFCMGIDGEKAGRDDIL